MADSYEAHNHPVDRSNTVRPILTGTELQAMLEIAVNKAVDRVLKDHKQMCENIPNKGYKKRIMRCGICRKTDHKTHECKDLKDATCYGCGEKGRVKTRCPKKATKEKGTWNSQAKPCGICNKEGHKTLECQDIKDATCYGCKEIGHTEN
ncbi:cellular nucleic acid-binding protein-like [Helianthus annuus]|uniref:cellular nucleic acid-binding protein-like n=1 Tax=Helianthus annuus TaxID=4232 RepID=UPI000B908E8E|nr:cellular nucleic acid-binding protein-like [Helianthus annuus]